MLRFVLLLTIVVFSFSGYAQVPNNQISQRYHLGVDDVPVSSTTTHSSVEWQCISKSLTNRCLVYHNDQWFSFTVAKSGLYYINLSAQTCSKKLGTQLILIEGNPCEVKTYRIRKCISRLPREDSFIRADSLQAGVTYLINIDGFLGDECDFAIQVSTKPAGFPLVAPIAAKDTLHVKKELKKEIAKLTWFIEDEKAPGIRGFKVLRSSVNDVKAKLVNEQPIRRNTYGAYELRYMLTDTLPGPGVYSFKIFGEQIDSDELVLLATEYARYDVKVPVAMQPIQRELILTLNYEEGTPFKIMVIDPNTSAELYKHQQRFEAGRDRDFKIDLGTYIDKGKKEFMIIISDFSTRGSKEFFYTLDAKGKLVRQ